MPRIDDLDTPPAVESHQAVPAGCGTDTGSPASETAPAADPRHCGRCHVVLDGESPCAGCTTCDRCGADVVVVRTTVTLSGQTICVTCRVNWHWQCGTCDGWIADGSTCDDCPCEDTCECDDCRRQPQADGDAVIYQYSFKPAPRFHGPGPLFLGLELELETPYARERTCAVRANRGLGDLGYLKHDESIHSGFEIVTHPMAYQWAIEHFPWTLLTELQDLGCHVDDHVGIHVHMSRAGFDSPCHVYRWMKLVYRNEYEVTALARRASSRWAAFNDDDRRAVKDFAKGARGSRYTAINTSNADTFELRVFASSVDPGEVQAALAFAAASVEYTRELTAHDILRGGWTWASFAGWVAARPQFAPLTRQLEALACAC